jgi:hypothetical protein
MEANKNFAKWLSCGIQISGTFGLHHVLWVVCLGEWEGKPPNSRKVACIYDLNVFIISEAPLT